MKTNNQEAQTIHQSAFKRIDLIHETEIKYVRKQFFQHDNIRIYQTIQRMDSKCFPIIYEINTLDQGFEVIEEYIDGVLLQDALPFEHDVITANYALQIAEALERLHKHHIVYRDLKPDNIMIRKNKIVLIDFDISKPIHPNRTRDTKVLGSVGYAAPEQYGFSISNEQSDIYAFGVLLNEMCTGRHIQEEFTTGKFKYIIKKCTQLEPSKRYQTIAQLKVPLIQIQNHKSRYTLPGFRSGIKSHMVIATMVYLLFIVLIYNTNAASGRLIDTVDLKVVVSYWFFITVAFLCNYLDINRINPMKKHRWIASILLWLSIWFLGTIAIQILFTLFL